MARSVRCSLGGRIRISVVVLILFGAALRIGYACRCGVAYDEVFVMGVGLDELSSWRTFLVDVPIRRSDGITPLWWWVQAVPGVVIGHLSLWGMRALSVVLGVGMLVVTWRLAAPRIGRGPASIAVGLAAVSDVLAYTNTHGEFAESLLLLTALPALGLVGQPRHAVLRGALWLALLMTHLGKGLFLTAGLVVAEAVSVVAGPHRRNAAWKLVVSAAIALVPTIIWLLGVDAVAFSEGPVRTDAGLRDSVWHAFRAITFGYDQAKRHMVAGSLDALQVYLDGVVWPTTTILAVPVLVGVMAVVVGLARHGLGGRRRLMAACLLPWIAAGLAVVVGRGMVGARFHLLYLPAAWIVAAIGLWRMRRIDRRLILLLALIWAVHLAFAFSWSSWSGRRWAMSITSMFALGPVLLLMAALGWAKQRSTRWRLAGPIAALLLVAGLATGGPWRWGPAARFEPMRGPAGSQECQLLTAIDAWRGGEATFPPPHGRTLYIDLANYFLAKTGSSPQDVKRAVGYAKLETRRVPRDARAWFYLGLAYQRDQRPAARIREAWERSYELRPSPLVAQHLQELTD